MRLFSLRGESAQVRIKKEFLTQIERIVPWGVQETRIRSWRYNGESGNKPYNQELVLRLYLLQPLSDETTAGETIDRLHRHCRSVFHEKSQSAG